MNESKEEIHTKKGVFPINIKICTLLNYDLFQAQAHGLIGLNQIDLVSPMNIGYSAFAWIS